QRALAESLNRLLSPSERSRLREDGDGALSSPPCLCGAEASPIPLRQPATSPKSAIAHGMSNNRRRLPSNTSGGRPRASTWPPVAPPEGQPMTFVRDLRYALRLFRREPGFTLAAVLTLTLGIGANTALFAVVEAALLRPFPFADADRLVMLRYRDLQTGIT